MIGSVEERKKAEGLGGEKALLPNCQQTAMNR